jgi:hypothetical protein
MHRRSKGCENADSSKCTHKTIGSTVKVYYVFHPLHGQELEVACRPRREDGCVTVIDPEGVRLKIPGWMLLSEAERHALSNQAAISGSALIGLCDLIGIDSGQDTVDSTQAPGVRPMAGDKQQR